MQYPTNQPQYDQERTHILKQQANCNNYQTIQIADHQSNPDFCILYNLPIFDWCILTFTWSTLSIDFNARMFISGWNAIFIVEWWLVNHD